MPTLRKLTSNINLFQLKGQDLALSNDMNVFLRAAFDVIVTLHTRRIILIDQLNIN